MKMKPAAKRGYFDKTLILLDVLYEFICASLWFRFF